MALPSTTYGVTRFNRQEAATVPSIGVRMPYSGKAYELLSGINWDSTGRLVLLDTGQGQPNWWSTPPESSSAALQPPRSPQ
jgi:hypothetical protein